MAGWKILREDISTDMKEKLEKLVDFYHEEVDQSKNVVAIRDQWSGKYYLIGHVIAEVDPNNSGEVIELSTAHYSLGEEYSRVEVILPSIKDLLRPEDMSLFLISHAW